MSLSTLIVVDGSNLYNDAARCLEIAVPLTDDASRKLRYGYFFGWFDADRLISATLAEHSRLLDYLGGGMGTVILHSLNTIGSKTNGSLLCGHRDVSAFWARQGSAESTSTMLVDVVGAPGSKKEVGVDTSIVVHLFETMDQWDAAVLFTNDSDLVPAVWSLRRRGKRVYCSSPTSPEEEAAKPLIQASQSFFRWDLDFLKADYTTFEMLQPGGALDNFLAASQGTVFKSLWVHRWHGHLVLDRGLPRDQRAGQNQLGFALDALQPLLPHGIKATLDHTNDWLLLSTSIGHGWTFAAIRRHVALFEDAGWHKRWSTQRG